MTHFPVSGSYRLGGREMRRGRGTGSGGSGGGVGGMKESSSGLVGSWRSRDCTSRFGLSSCVGLAGVRLGYFHGNFCPAIRLREADGGHAMPYTMTGRKMRAL